MEQYLCLQKGKRNQYSLIFLIINHHGMLLFGYVVFLRLRPIYWLAVYRHGKLKKRWESVNDVSFFNTHQNISVCGKDLNNNTSVKVHLVNVSQPLSDFLTGHWACVPSNHNGKDQSQCWAQQHEPLLTNSHLGTTTGVGPLLQKLACNSIPGPRWVNSNLTASGSSFHSVLSAFSTLEQRHILREQICSLWLWHFCKY